MKRVKTFLLLGCSFLFACGAVVLGQAYSNQRQETLNTSAKTTVATPKKETKVTETKETETKETETQETTADEEETSEEVTRLKEAVSQLIYEDGSFNPNMTSDQIYDLENQIKQLDKGQSKDNLLNQMKKVKDYFGL